jgi:thiol:disulfide interchange protein DsbA
MIRIAGGMRRCLALTMLGVIAACGGPSDQGTAEQAAAAPPPPAATAPETPAAAPTQAPATPAAPQAAPAGVQESTADTGGGEQLKLASTAQGPEPQWRFQEGRDFKVLTSAQGVTSSPDKIEVTEAFWYGCSHCYEFDPIISSYAEKLPGDVAFVRLPVMWNPTNQIHARLYYTAQVLGKLGEMHGAIFREIHVNKNMLTTEDDIQKLFAQFGVSETDFRKTFRSFAVDGMLNRAKELTERYQVRSVPLMIVNGKYNTDAPGIKNYDNMLQVIDELVERERRR